MKREIKKHEWRTFYICLTRDIKEGQYKCFDIMGHKLIAKKQDGKITVARNSCSHRGFPVGEDGGLLPVKCPYHGLPFNFHSIIRTAIIGEMLFAVDGNDAILSYDLELISSYIGEQFGLAITSVEAPMHLWMQNTMDPNHLQTVHRDFKSVFTEDLPHTVKHDVLVSSYQMNIVKSVSERYQAFLPKGQWLNKNFTHMIVMPHLSITVFAGVFISVETALPVDDNRSLVKTRFFVSKNSKVPKTLLESAYIANLKILEEDKILVERWAQTYAEHQTTFWLPGEERIASYVKKIEGTENESISIHPQDSSSSQVCDHPPGCDHRPECLY